MTRNILETVSALMDGQLQDGEPEAIRDLIRDESARQAWGRYHLISDCMRGDLPSRMDPRLAERISIALRNEPTVMAPQPSFPRAIIKPIAGFAIAASVAALAIVGVQLHHDARELQPVAKLASAQLPPLQPEGHISLASGHPRTQPARPQLSRGRLNSRLNRYLVNYNEYRNNAAVQGMFPYVRIVAHEKDE